ncbi:NADH-ubiquinone oxidoreductase B18 subunit-domain-containing protein [Russula earlei]|uniref:NADH-ubiquinone oxidoreductase B18 subunit-domain-containing protein n=2 Tax=Russula earlei TaxID=71964 RepID=A0ACC0U3E2_9AGAM|nr:NADH-ubiquinone oxidoreductase B18 subunit-domain-containing protein [Russula earlei]KAI9461060.1 NADH-ubiquinone oxidoreductase B18 subunit-domain-containing protein [Russula earlei]
MSSSTTASQEELKAHRVPLAWRDQCSALLLPLNVCRKENYYLPWECENERHAYEKHVSSSFYIRRMRALSKQKLREREAATE